MVMHVLRVGGQEQWQDVPADAVLAGFYDASYDRAGLHERKLSMGPTKRAPTRVTYEAADYNQWPVARYFKEL